MDSTPLQSLDYAQPAQSLRPASVNGAKACLGISVLSVSVGVLILIGYRFTANDDLVGFGLTWLMIGGALTSICLLTSFVLLAITRRNALNAEVARKYHAQTVVVCLLSYAVAFGCVVLGANWVEGPHFRLNVYNDTTVDLHDVTVHFTGADITVGPIKAGGVATTGLNWSGKPGDVHVTVEAAGEKRRFHDRFFAAKHHLQQPFFDIRIEPVELPKLVEPVEK